MHVCIILDEAGDICVRSWFESKSMLTALCDEAANLAKSVAVVVTGTALTGRELNSKNDAYIFRMKSWRADDLEPWPPTPGAHTFCRKPLPT